MRKWATITVTLYGLALVGLTWPVSFAAFSREQAGREVLGCWIFWAGLAVMLLAQAALLVVPVRQQSDRPVTRRALAWPVTVALFLFLLLAAGMATTVTELLQYKLLGDGALPVIAVAVLTGIWLVWAFLFGFYTGAREPKTVMSRLVKNLLVGSILELLISVPAHVYARSKNDCCGGFGTIWGIVAGVAVMLLAFGPAVFVLFARRVRSLRPPQQPS
ncbi:MAG: hypothetical protein NT031_11645 [Planctomycetota bacterium]|nr:hypothetical protein [Planctomycetota bacterium]